MSIIFRILNIAIIVAAVTLPVGAAPAGRGTGISPQEALNRLQEPRSQPMTQEELEEKIKGFEESLGPQNYTQKDSTRVFNNEEMAKMAADLQRAQQLAKNRKEAVASGNLEAIVNAYSNYDACVKGAEPFGEDQPLKPECVRLFQKGVKVTMGSGVGLIKIYMSRYKNNEEIRCVPSFYTRGYDDYLTCVSAKTVYTFAFDSLNPSSDRTVKQGITNGLVKMTSKDGKGTCTFHGTSSTCNGYYGQNKTLEDSLKLFGYRGKFFNYLNQSPYYEIYYLAFTDEGQLRTIDGVNNKRFRYFKTQFMADLEIYLKNYVERALVAQGKELKTFNCLYGSRQLKTGKYTDIPHDDVLTCWANKNPIDFVFDDLTEPIKTISQGGTAGLECITLHGGNYLNGTCQGFTKEQCLDKIAPNVKNGAYWDDDLNACVLNNAKDAEKLERNGESALKIGAVWVTAIASLKSGNKKLIVAAWTAAIGTTVVEVSKNKTDKEITQIISTSNLCKCDTCTTSACARCTEDALRTFMVDMAQVPESNVRDKDKPSIAEEYDRLVTCLIKEKGQAVADALMKDTEIRKLNLSEFDSWPPSRKLLLVGRGLQAIAALIGAQAALAKIPTMLDNLQTATKAVEFTWDVGKKLSNVESNVSGVFNAAKGAQYNYNNMVGLWNW